MSANSNKEGLRKVSKSNALEIESFDILQPYSHDYRKELELVAFVKEMHNPFAQEELEGRCVRSF